MATKLFGFTFTIEQWIALPRLVVYVLDPADMVVGGVEEEFDIKALLAPLHGQRIYVAIELHKHFNANQFFH